MILHTVNKSPFSNSSMADCIRFCADADSVLLLEDGVYAAQKKSKFVFLLKQKSTVNFYALEADIKARGLIGQTHELVSIINDNEFVSLATTHNCVQSWF